MKPVARIIDSLIHGFDWRRYSNSQERKRFMGGMLGSVTYEGKLAEHVPLLDFAEKVHLGRQGDIHKIIKLKTFPLTFTKLMDLPLFV